MEPIEWIATACLVGVIVWIYDTRTRLKPSQLRRNAQEAVEAERAAAGEGKTDA
jgi:hypothetical protein